MRKFLKLYLLTLALASILMLPGWSVINAAEDNKNLQTCNPTEDLKTCQARILKDAGGGPSGFGDSDNLLIDESTLAVKVGKVIGMVLSVFGVVFFGLVVYSGIQWMTAGGNEEKVTHARERIIRAAIGLGIVMMAYALTSFIVSRMQTTSVGAPAGGQIEDRNAECHAAHDPTWNCQNIASCDQTNIDRGKCRVGADNNDANIVCCKAR